MKNFYSQLPTSAKFIFLLATIPLSAIVGGIIGFLYGLAAVNFIPDNCSQGIHTVCQNPFEFLGFVGWEGTALLGLICGAGLTLIVYLIIIIKWQRKK